ncbi:MAG: hypothetical protein JWN50_670 [Parcubacteria group bacterium]|nr:hypothetical protein [Parcubacteria group bacterium]
MPCHDVREDRTGFTTDALFDRIICLADRCLRASRVRQPWMTDAEWKKIIEKFRSEHPMATRATTPQSARRIA